MREFQRNNRGETVRIVREDFKGTDLVNIRIWFRGDDDVMRPTKTGLTIRGDQIDAMIEALQGVKAEGVPTSAG